MRPNDAQLLSTLKDDLRDKGDENALLREQLQGLEVQVAELKGSQTAFLETIQVSALLSLYRFSWLTPIKTGRGISTEKSP